MDSSIFDHSPWLVSEDRFSRVSNIKVIESLLQSARDSHTFLTLCEKGLNLHFKSVLIRVGPDTFQIDKPIEWERQSKEFQIFFRDSVNCWNMINGQLVNEGLYALTVSVPDKIYRLNSRRNTRVEIAEDTTASFLTGKSSINDLQVLNLSRTGMLVCGLSQDECLPVDSIINKISINLPEKDFQKASTRIDEGKIVRAFQRTESQQTCLAISFVRDDQHGSLELNGFLPKE